MFNQLFFVVHMLLFSVTVSRDSKDIMKYIGDRMRIFACKHPACETCTNGGKHMCMPTKGAKPLDIQGCCTEGYELKCCQTTTTTTPTTPLPKEIALHQRCKFEESNCLCGWGACIKRQGWAAGGCCDEGFEFRCCQSESIVQWERVRTTDLVKYMQAKDECKDTQNMCLCGFEKVNHYIMGVCCDDGACLCCRKDPALFKLPEVLLAIMNSTECQENMPCKNNMGEDTTCLNTLSCTAYCVWSEGFKASPCCKENYTAICWNWAPRPAKLLLSTQKCYEKPEVLISMVQVLDYNKKTDSYCASHAYMIPDTFLHTIKELAGEVVAGSVRVAVTPNIPTFLCFMVAVLFLPVYVMVIG